MDEDETVTYKRDISRFESEKWLEATKYEMYFMYTNQLWTLVEPMKEANPIGYK